MKRSEISLVLDKLKEIRKKIIDDFLFQTELGDTLREYMFKYENEKTLTEVAVEHYKISIIDYHLRLTNYENEKIKNALIEFLSSYIIGEKLNDKDLFNNLINKKIDSLNAIVEFSKNADKKIKKFEIQQAKDSALFKRKLKELEKRR
ncbi:hypothetical protein OFO10_06650 [Campylobacter sp. VBCF_06 NA8]|uniref:hypothetical protein n=1 Tax=Campylobacter sp. VBCF_06 NA8 TaxID=2983822 RepID=UPI0022E9E8D4|nr:hypothetical protein [Campylobacter sp. VBCF_06 NA8]MDA3046833.1 hypothetical protein [Campylobacter sp. VBCF_06 NA8]